MVVIAAVAAFAFLHEGPMPSPAPTHETRRPAAPPSGEADVIASLISPKKLATLKGERAANSRLCKVSYWLVTARRSGHDCEAVIREAQRLAEYSGTARAREDSDSLLRNLTILERLGCLDEAGLAKLRKGNSPLVTRGPYAGDIASVDHILPFSLARELDKCFYNLEFMPSKLNGRKGNRVGERQESLARKWNGLGLLSESGMRAILERSGSGRPWR